MEHIFDISLLFGYDGVFTRKAVVMGAESYWIVRKVEDGRFAVVMGLESEDYSGSGGYPSVDDSVKRFDTVGEAVDWTLSDDAVGTDYGTIIHPECLPDIQDEYTGGDDESAGNVEVERLYCVEIRFDVLATESEVHKKAADAANSIGGYVSAVFDENWDEV